VDVIEANSPERHFQLNIHDPKRFYNSSRASTP